eukprot:CAMPEP_0194276348 /NCGR_PEP_ID=MMETSP0169-20130528/8961_1 /TAXON_ID=218684 /ORGANISM="Corethron pennatum, Strain L29A3" /LENGTH=202 /DNA_ID=CAMNT_0039020047 /DNA_START=220 /DNA_END=828 /DNA_ORIENTATION=-
MTKEMRREKYTSVARERRILKAEARNDAGLVCFRCRKKGHTASRCTEVEGGPEGDSVCYHCGSTEHRLGGCEVYKRKRKRCGDGRGLLPYATCYVCKKSGHLASACPNNTGRGIYVNGGECRGCGGVDHLYKDCPGENITKTKRSKNGEVEEESFGIFVGLGGDDLLEKKDEQVGSKEDSGGAGYDGRVAGRKKVNGREVHF